MSIPERLRAEQTVRAYYAAFNAGDMAHFLDLLAEDVCTTSARAGARWGGRRSGASWIT